jgi:type I restriction enzyme S subunit
MQENGQPLPATWRRVKIGELCRLLGGFAFKSKEYQKNGIPVVRISNVKDGGLDWSSKVFWTEDLSPELNRYLLREGEVLISMTGDVGVTCQVRKADLPALLNQRVGRFSIKAAGELTNDFLLFVTKTDDFRHTVSGNAFGAIQQNVSAKGIEVVEFNLPPPAEQEKIAGVLNLVQRAMEQQQQLLALTVELKKALLHQLFTYGLRHETQKQTELGPVPQSWEVVELGSIADLINGFAFKSEDYVSSGVLNFRVVNTRDEGVIDTSSDTEFLPNEFMQTHSSIYFRRAISCSLWSERRAGNWASFPRGFSRRS